jgi:hypothetical protein
MIPVQRHRLGERQRIRHAELFQHAADHGNKADVAGCGIRFFHPPLPFSLFRPD